MPPLNKSQGVLPSKGSRVRKKVAEFVVQLLKPVTCPMNVYSNCYMEQQDSSAGSRVNIIRPAFFGIHYTPHIFVHHKFFNRDNFWGFQESVLCKRHP